MSDVATHVERVSSDGGHRFLDRHRTLTRVGRLSSLGARGVTLVEALITVAIIALISGVAILAIGAGSGARLKRASVEIAGAIRIAYAHSTANSKTVRIVFDFEANKMTLEETSARHLVTKSLSGGAEPATEAERAAEEEKAALAEGPKAPKAQFSPAKAFGFPPDGIELPAGIGFWQIETGHQENAVGEGRAYLYFFPNGQTENAAIQLRISNSSETDDSAYTTVQVSPLTGKASITRGRSPMPRPRDDVEASERTDTGL